MILFHLYKHLKMLYKNISLLSKFIFTLVFLSVSSNLFSQSTVTITPTADSELYNGSTTTNYGVCDQMWVGYGGATAISRSVILFDLTSVPTGATIISATLELEVINNTGTNLNVSVHQVTNFWFEGTGPCTGTPTMPVSWNIRSGTTPWAAAGGDYNTTAVSSTSVGDEGTYSWDVTALVTSWTTSSTANHGFLLRATPESGSNVKYFATKEHADESFHPRLVITYTIPTTSPVWHSVDQKDATGSGNLLIVDRPDNVSEGDLIILIFTQQNNPGSFSTETSGFTVPTGFTLIRNQRYAAIISAPEVAAYFKIASNNEPLQYTSNVSSYPVTPKWKAVAARITGHDPVTPIFPIDTGAASNTISSSSSSPQINLTYPNSLLVAARTVRTFITNEVTPNGMILNYSQNGTGTVDANTNDPALRVTTEIRSNSGLTGSRLWSWTNAAFNCNLMFSINPQIGLPGGVATPNLWVKANSGVVPNTEAGSVSTWRNFNNVTTITQGTAANRPIYRKTTNLINFNPVIQFDGVNDYISTNNNYGVYGTSLFTDFVIANRFTQTTEDDFWGQSNTSARYASHSMYTNLPNQNINSSTFYKHGTTTISLNTPFLVNVKRTNSNTFQLYHNGTTDGTSGSITSFTGTFQTSNLRLGSRSNSNRSFSGTIAEIIIYPSALSDANLLRINSYLAIKYGISMNDGIGAQYIASDGTTIFWNNPLNTGYNYGIFGIGKDNLSTLQQQISRSSHTSDILTVSTDNNFTAPNTYHNAINLDLSFMMFGNNNGATTTQSSELNLNMYNSRISREWKVQNTDFTDTVCLKFDGFGSTALSTVYLIKKNNNSDFSSGTTEVGALNANGEITGIILNNNDYFTLAYRDCAPGGVVNELKFWVKADNGPILSGNNVTQWVDQSGNSRDLFQNTDILRPTLSQSAQNFNPAVHFTAANTQFFERNPNFDIFAGSYSIYIVGYNTSGQRSFLSVSETGGSSVNSGIHIEYNDSSDPPLMRFLHRNPPSQAGGDNLVQSVNIFNTRSNVMSFYRNTTTKHKFSINGETEVSLTPAVAAFTAGVFTDMTVGQLGSENQRYLDGDIAELLIYNTDNETDKAKIESYLAIKYGISLNDGTGTNYIASDGSTIFWNSASNSGFNYDIFGIGRDDRSCLHQKQSKTTNNDPFFSVYFLNNESEALPATNLLNTANIPNNYDFLMFGNNNGNISEWYRFDEMPPFLISRIERIWKVQKTGSITASVIAVNTADLPTNTLNLPVYLIVSSSPTLEDAEYYPMDLLGTTWRISYNFTTNTYISFGYGVNLAPMRHGKGVVEGETVPYK